jgi:uncharacterized membrane protein (UPF0127 family)
MKPRMDHTRAWALALIVASAVGFLGSMALRAQTPPPVEELSAFPQATLTVSGSGGSHQFSIWVANTAPREEQGLMFVRELAADKGMVFFGEEPKVWNMWMKNTYIPLDMLFVALDGRVVKIAHAIPHDETTVSSDVVVHAVIELQGGISDRLHIKVGDLAKWK